MKNSCVAFFLIFFFGWLGLHQVYLKRPRHAFFHFATFGGLGFALLYDMLSIPKYIHACNLVSGDVKVTRPADSDDVDGTPTFLLSSKQKKELGSWQLHRLFAEIVLAVLMSFWAVLAFPEDMVENYPPYYAFTTYILLPCQCALGVWIVGNIGDESLKFTPCLVGAYAMVPILYIYGEGVGGVLYPAIASAFWANYSSHAYLTMHEMRGKELSQCAVICVYIFCCSLYLLCFLSAIYHNTTITDHHGHKVYVKDAMKSFMASDAWDKMKDFMGDFWTLFWAKGFNRAWRMASETGDLSGEKMALRTLGLAATATESDITAACRKLMKQYHPDKHRDATEKKKAEDTFVQVNQACQRLGNIRSRGRSEL